MSADNWAICPRCKRKAEAERDALERQVSDSYGKLPVDEFDALRERARQPLDIEETFREDYEFYGAESGVVTASYSGECQKCGLKLSFNEDHPIPDVGVSMKLHRWEDIEAEAMADPARQQRVEDEKRALIRQYNRPWWRLVRAWDPE